MLTSLKNNEDYILIPPLLTITLEYAFNKCVDCQQFYVDTFECKTCKTIRCTFHHFLNSTIETCVTCGIYYMHTYNRLYNCVVCGNKDAAYGYEFKICKDAILNNASNIKFYCATHAHDESYDVCKLPIISYVQYCQHILTCYSTGYFKDTKSKKILCEKHAKLYENQYITHNYVESLQHNYSLRDNIKEISVNVSSKNQFNIRNTLIIGGILGCISNMIYYITNR